MNWAPPKFIQQAHADALERVEANHYQLPRGNVRLRKALSKYLSPSFKRDLDPNTEIQITAGANEGASSFLSPLSQGRTSA